MIFFLLGDDCIAINTGSSDINITSVDCGPGHGIRFAHRILYIIVFTGKMIKSYYYSCVGVRKKLL